MTFLRSRMMEESWLKRRLSSSNSASERPLVKAGGKAKEEEGTAGDDVGAGRGRRLLLADEGAELALVDLVHRVLELAQSKVVRLKGEPSPWVKEERRRRR